MYVTRKNRASNSTNSSKIYSFKYVAFQMRGQKRQKKEKQGKIKKNLYFGIYIMIVIWNQGVLEAHYHEISKKSLNLI